MYKLVRVQCNYFGIQRVVEEYLVGYEQHLFKASHRKLWCWLDFWFARELSEVIPPAQCPYQGIKTETCGAGLPQLREVEARLNRETTARMRGALGGVSTEHENLALDTSLHSNLSFNSVNDSASARHSSFLNNNFLAVSRSDLDPIQTHDVHYPRAKSALTFYFIQQSRKRTTFAHSATVRPRATGRLLPLVRGPRALQTRRAAETSSCLTRTSLNLPWAEAGGRSEVG